MDRREGKKEAKRNGGCVIEILLAIEIILFLFVCELFIINFFLLFNLCGFFFCYPLFFCYTLPCFFVNLGGLSLPCHLLCCLLLFVYLFIHFFIFFFFMDFLLFFFVSLIALGTSSLRLIMFPLAGWLHRAPVSRTGIEG